MSDIRQVVIVEFCSECGKACETKVFKGSKYCEKCYDEAYWAYQDFLSVE